MIADPRTRALHPTRGALLGYPDGRGTASTVRDPGASRTRAELSFRRGIFKFVRHHARDFPWRATRDPYLVLIGTVLLQRTTGGHVQRVFDEFIARWPTPRELATAEEDEIKVVLRPLGLGRRAHQVAQLGRELGRLGVVPQSPEVLMGLPGVGRYTAHAVPILASNRNLPLVDWVIARVLRRYFGLTGSKRPNEDEELWGLARDIARVGRARTVWLGTVDLANSFCRPRPKCGTCPLRSACCYARGGACDDQAHLLKPSPSE